MQEWLKKKPNVLAKDEDERLLIIQEEFSDFDETNERFDLLAIDIVHQSERFSLEEMKRKNPEKFLKEYANCA